MASIYERKILALSRAADARKRRTQNLATWREQGDAKGYGGPAVVDRTRPHGLRSKSSPAAAPGDGQRPNVCDAPPREDKPTGPPAEVRQLTRVTNRPAAAATALEPRRGSNNSRRLAVSEVDEEIEVLTHSDFDELGVCWRGARFLKAVRTLQTAVAWFVLEDDDPSAPPEPPFVIALEDLRGQVRTKSRNVEPHCFRYLDPSYSGLAAKRRRIARGATSEAAAAVSSASLDTHSVHCSWEKVRSGTTNVHGKRVHQIFGILGDGDMNELFRQSSAAWRRWAGKGNYKLWGRSEVEKLVKTYPKDIQELYFNADYLIMRVDIARFLILESHGGIYSDLDCFPGGLVSDVVDFGVARNHRMFEIEYLEARAGHPLLLKFLRYVITVIPEFRDSQIKNGRLARFVYLTTGPRSFTRYYKHEMTAQEREGVTVVPINRPYPCVVPKKATLVAVSHHSCSYMRNGKLVEQLEREQQQQ